MLFVPTGAFAQATRATIVAVEGAETTYQSQDMGGRMVQVEVPSQSLADIRTNSQSSARMSSPPESAGGTVQAHVVAVDTLNNRVKVQTQAGQTIALDMQARDIQIGEPLTLVIPRRP
jgi:hypothetical protein